MSYLRLAIALVILASSVFATPPALAAPGSAPGRAPASPDGRQLHTWQFNLIQGWPRFATNGNSLKIDATGRAHIVYGGSRLIYALVDGDAVTRTMVSTNSVHDGFALALDGAQKPVISFVPENEGRLKLARPHTQTWQITTVAPERDYVRGNTAIAVDSADRVHIASRAKTEPHHTDFYVDTQNANNWTSSQIAFAHPFTFTPLYCEYGYGSGFFTLKIDSQARQHVAGGGHCGTYGLISYAYNLASATDTGWITRTTNTDHMAGLSVDNTGTPWLVPSMTVDLKQVETVADDASHHAHLATLTVQGIETDLLTYEGCVSCTQTSPAAIGLVDNEIPFGTVGLDIDRQGRPHLVYVRLNTIIYARWTGSEWQKTVVDSYGRGSQDFDAVVQVNGHMHVAYRDPKGSLWLSSRESSGWHDQLVAEAVTQVAVTSDGTSPHLAYITSKPSGALVYARRDGSNWVTETITTSMQDYRVMYPDIVLDQANQPHVISYGLRPSLSSPFIVLHFWRSNGEWRSTRLQSTGADPCFVPAWLLRKHNGQPFLMWLDRIRDDYGSSDCRLPASYRSSMWDGASWVDAGPAPVTDTLIYAVALDNNDWPRLLGATYGFSPRRVFDRWNGNAWVRRDAPDIPYGGGIAIAIGPNNLTTIATVLTNTVTLYQRLGVDFNAETIESGPSTPWKIQLGIDGANHPHMVALGYYLYSYEGIPRSFAFLPQVVR